MHYFNIVTDKIKKGVIAVVFDTEIQFDIEMPHNCCKPIKIMDFNETYT